MPDITIQNLRVAPGAGPRVPTTVRAFPRSSFLLNDADKTAVTETSPYDAGAHFKSVTLAPNGHYYKAPFFTLPSTTDSPDNPNEARWGLHVYDQNGRWMYAVAGLEAFRLDASDLTQTAEDIIAYNLGALPAVTPTDRTVGRDLSVGRHVTAGGDGIFGGDVTAQKVIADLSLSVGGGPGSVDGTNYETLINDGSVDIQANADGAHPSAIIQTKHGTQIISRDYADRREMSVPLFLEGSKGAAVGVAELGSAAYRDVGTEAGTVAAGDDARLAGWTPQGTVLRGRDSQSGNVYEPSVLVEGSPQILTGHSQVFKMWFTGGWDSTVGVYYTEAADGRQWAEPVAIPALSGYARGFMVREGATHYYYAVPFPAQNRVDVFTSADGEPLALAAAGVLTLGAPGQWDDFVIANVSVLNDGGTWQMMYEAARADNIWQIGLASAASPTGPFSRSGSGLVLPVSDGFGGRGGPHLFKQGSTYYLFFHRTPTSGQILPTDLFLTSSADLVTWAEARQVLARATRDEGAGSAVGQVADPFAVEVSGKTFLFYSASADGSDALGQLRIKLATRDEPLSAVFASPGGRRLAGAADPTADSLPRVPQVRAYHDTGQEVPSGQWTALALNNVRWDTDTMHDPAVNSRITIRTPGLYDIKVHVVIAAGPATDKYARVRLNGAVDIAPAGPVSGATDARFSFPAEYRFSAGDYFQVEVFHSAGVPLLVVSAPNYSPEVTASWRSN